MKTGDTHEMEQRLLDMLSNARAGQAEPKAAPSTGPTSAEGKVRSSRNAIKHGLYAKTHIVLSHESQDDYDQMRHEYHAELQPATRLERDLVDEIVNCRWRMQRIGAVESATIETLRPLSERKAPGEDEATLLALAFSDLGRASEKFRRLETSLSRQFQRALRDLRTLQQERRKQEAECAAQARTAPQPQPQPSSFPQMAMSARAKSGSTPAAASEKPSIPPEKAA